MLLDEHADIDAVITDFTMPRMSGAQLANEVRSLRPQLPVLLITGFASDDIDAALPQLLKPFRQDELADALKRLLTQRSRCC